MSLDKQQYEKMIDDIQSDISNLEREIRHLVDLRAWAEDKLASLPVLDEVLPPSQQVRKRRVMLGVEAVRSYVQEAKIVTIAMVAKRYNVSRSQARNKLNHLVEMGTVEMVLLEGGSLEFRFVKPEPSPSPNGPSPKSGTLEGGAEIVAPPVPGTGARGRYSTNKDYQDVIDEAIDDGWSLKDNSLVKPGKGVIRLHPTPSDRRAAANLRATIKRA